MLNITVQDNGMGFPPQILKRLKNGEDISENGEHIGILNVRERIHVLYEREADIRIESRAGRTTVTVRLPLVAVKEESPCGYPCMPKKQGKEEESPCGYPCMPKKQGKKEESPCGYPCMPKKQGKKEEI